MKRVKNKDFFREIKGSLNRYLSILFIVALGVAFFSGVRSAEPDMRLSVDAVADEANFMDIRVLSTMGLTKGDLESIRQVPGITAAEGEYSADVLCECAEKELVLHVASMTEQVNRVTVKQGRLPEKPGECFLDEQLLVTTDYTLGDEITIKSGTSDPITDILERDTYTIVGIGSSPYYLNSDKGTATIGNGDIQGFLMVMPEEFSSDIYTQIYAAADGLDSYVTAGKAYQAEADRLKTAVEEIAEARCEIRREEILADADEEIADAEKELADKKAEAEEELSDAWKKITDGEAELADGLAEIEKNEKKLADGQAEIEDNEKKLADGWAEVRKNEQKLKDGRESLEAGRKELEYGRAELIASQEELESGKAVLSEKQEALASGEEALASAREEYEAGVSQAAAGRTALLAAQSELDRQSAELDVFREQLIAAGLNPEENEQYMAGLQALNEGWAELAIKRAVLEETEAKLQAAGEVLDAKEAELAAGKAALSAALAELSDGEAALSSGWQEFYASEAELEAAFCEIEDGEKALEEVKKTLTSGDAELEEAKEKLKDGKAELADARKELEDGEAELADAKKEYEDGKAEAEEKIADAEAEIADAREELADLELPEWYVLDRTSVRSYVEYDSDADKIAAIGRVFPVLFFLVAALVSLTTMTRMVEEKRTEIGTMKALGYSTLSIASKYIGYALSASLIGSVLGFLVGEKFLPWVIITTYKILYVNLNIIKIPYNWGYALGATGIAVICTAGATLAACYRSTLSQPSELMRPTAPLNGQKILLERVKPLWRRFNFSQKSTLRNLLRYKKRLLMTVFGIGACMALLIVGFGLRDSIYAVSDCQYGELWKYDAVVGVDTESSSVRKNQLKTMLAKQENIDEALAAHTEALKGEANGVTKEINLVVPEEFSEFPDFFVLRDRITKEKYALEDSGAVISEKLAEQLGIRPGDSLLIKEDDAKGVSVKISHIAENYVYNYVYLSPSLYQEIFGKEAEYNAEYLRLYETGEEKERELAEALLDEEAVTGVTLVSDMNQTILDMLGSLDTVVWVLITSAGLLAFVVVYNLNNINITERKRELATIKLLGFYDLELAAYVYRENILLTLIGILAGIFMGSVLHRFVIKTVEVDLIMFGREAYPVSYLYGMGLTFLFALLVNVAMFYKLRKIDMVESLKSVE